MTQALAIVAHPDDETIWMGTTILQNKKWDWTILCLTRKSDKDRMPKFKKVCRLYGAKGIILDLDDVKLNPLKISLVEKTIKDSLPKKRYDYIFTHGKNGEYGHIRHLETYKAVKRLVEQKELTAKKFFCFDYKKGKNILYPRLIAPAPKKYSDMLIKSTQKELNLKRKIVKDIYGYPNEKGFELLSCNELESFKRQN